MIVYLDENANNSCAGGWRTGHNTAARNAKAFNQQQRTKKQKQQEKAWQYRKITDKKMNNKESQ